ncbi:MBL fold metallo-hydrolase RNA specificity domain-containing protein [Larkinella bovis]|uniref:MBL fold metallo-hydrolase RNA specificity domain-containing protein n=1 Tax=Larkinella bovis TaxID=683041 RepID=A0ABW0IBJ3_9BACT
MKIQFFGAARTVTGSKHLITTQRGTRILLDCGLFQGINTDDLNQSFRFKAAEVDYLLLSHAHIDHSGLIPRLVRKGFSGPIYCTPATADLCQLMLLDSAHIQEKDLERVNERRKRQGRPLLDLLYETADVERALALIKTVDYGQTFWLSRDEVSVVFTDTAHLLGSAAISLTVREPGPQGEPTEKRLFFSGDIGRPHDKILKMPEPFPQADYILCESTYGDKRHEPEPDMQAHLLRIVHDTCVVRGGKLIIPAFAVDRTQELVYALDQLANRGDLPRLNVYIDSPMAVKATHLMKEHEECFNPEIRAYIEKDGDAFAFPNLHYISDVEDSKAINTRDEPCIIISASGMAEAGRIKHHIKNNVEDSRCTILIVGYCGPETLGGALKRGDAQVKIFGETFQVNADVEVMDSFSAHGDYQEMLDFLSCQNPAQVKRVFLVHGEYDRQVVFRQKLQSAGFENVYIPSLYESVEV